MNLDRLIQFYEPSNAVTAGGFPKPQVYSLIGSAWAAKNAQLKPGKPSVGIRDGQETSNTKESFTIRFEDKPAGAEPGWRIIDDDGERWEIEGLQEEGRRHWLRFLVIRSDNQFKYGEG